MALSPGQIINNRYRIAKLLGQGGMGAVYRAWDTTLDHPCALKENFDTSAAALRQFEREAKMLANLSHPSLPRVTDHFVLPRQGQYLVMDFIEGEDLEQMLIRAGSPLPEQQVLPWILQVCDALAYLHSQTLPIIHRDIKPANIKITPQGKAMLVDFGIAKAYDPKLSTSTGARAATQGYSPPEQYSGKTDTRSDIYSIGATLYHLITGRMLPESGLRAVGGTATLSPCHLNPQISQQIEKAILKAVEIPVDKRFQSVIELKIALGFPAGVTQITPASIAQLAQHPTDRLTVTPTSDSQQTIKWKKIGAIGGLLFIVGLGLIIFISFLLNFVTPKQFATKTALAFLLRTVEVTVTSSWTPIPSTAETATPLISSPTSTQTSSLMSTESGLNSSSTELPARIIDDKGVTMALVSIGEFLMGSESSESDERPVHTVHLNAFYIDIYEVTNALYTLCVEVGNCTKPGCMYYGNSTYDNHPVVCVNWEEAQVYCEWRGARLPTEAEWEKASRGTLEGKLYPWGDQAPDCSRVNYSGCKGSTVQVGSYPPNGYELFDMAGNVWEWVWDWYSENYYASSPSWKPGGPDSGNYRVMRGGSYYDVARNVRAALRDGGFPGNRFVYVGFRCARSP